MPVLNTVAHEARSAYTQRHFRAKKRKSSQVRGGVPWQQPEQFCLDSAGSLYAGQNAQAWGASAVSAAMMLGTWHFSKLGTRFGFPSRSAGRAKKAVRPVVTTSRVSRECPCRGLGGGGRRGR